MSSRETILWSGGILFDPDFKGREHNIDSANYHNFFIYDFKIDIIHNNIALFQFLLIHEAEESYLF